MWLFTYFLQEVGNVNAEQKLYITDSFVGEIGDIYVDAEGKTFLITDYAEEYVDEEIPEDWVA